MRLLVVSLLTAATVFGLSSCQTSSSSLEEAKKIAVSWELMSNFKQPQADFEARFVFKNNGNLTLTDSAWTLYFNISPRAPLPHPTPQLGKVEHINGDWFKLTPNKGFKLAPGDSVEIRYMGSEPLIKETDAPLGLYFVLQDGQNEQIVQVEDYTILPFANRDQQLRGPNDQVPIQTPALHYQQNAALSLLSADQLLRVIPTPVKMNSGSGTFRLSSRTTIYHTPDLANEAQLLAEKLKTITGSSFTLATEKPTTNAISLTLGQVQVNGVGKEAYQLRVDEKGVNITGSDAAGVFYGTQSLLSMIDPAAYAQKTETLTLPFVAIEDAPRFHFRSMHLDFGRNFQTKETVLRLLDVLATYKLNHILFYVTEDEGWRLEIDGLPELTEVGGQRQHTKSYKEAALHPAYGSGPTAYDKSKHGSGYFTKADFVEILKYAKARHIKVIPEANLPGHARAAIKAMEARYQRLMKEGKPKEAEEYRLADPDDTSEYISAQGYKDNVTDVTRESTYRFYEKVVDEVAKMYKEAGLTLDVFHIGGDEVPDDAWKKSPLALQLLKQEPNIIETKNLHAYFIRRLLPRLQKRGLQVHGWEEIAMYKKDGKYQLNPEFAGKNVVPYIWNNLYDPGLGYRLANAGYPVVLCNVTNFYFDLAYTNDPREPGLYWAGFVDTRDAYTFAPYQMYRTTEETSQGKPVDFTGAPALTPTGRKNIVGVECQLWSETVKGRDMLEYYTLPKLLGFAESAWAAERPWENIADAATRKKAILGSWNVFANSLAQRELPRLTHLNGGYNYRIPPPGAIIENGMLKANCALPGLTIRYTTDGTEPTEKSPAYQAPVKVNGSVKLKSFGTGGRSSRTVGLEDLK